MENEYLLDMRSIHKSFVGVKALQNVDFSIRYGEVHALMGENGAGKSTLMKIVSGIYQRDSGSMIFDGKEVDLKNAIEAKGVGIATIYQEINVLPELSVMENLFIGREIKQKNNFFIDWKKSAKEAKELLKRVGLTNIDIHQPIKGLGQ
ncbi:hypothetical protein FACS18947_6050 [Bacteroidia bacterium]|nr:hypothetical protein FACS18947_6050 [Bacteroidia bacterium]